MGISTGGGHGKIKSDINVTPLVDVVLVLLIIFLVTTPIMMHQISIEVPRDIDPTEAPPLASRQITVLVRTDGNAVITEGQATTECSLRDLPQTLQPILDKKKTEKVVFVDFEDEVAYGIAVMTMDVIKGVNADKIALKVRKEDEQPAPEQ